MANYNSSYTGAQIDAAVAKASAIPDPTGHLNTVLTHKTTGESWEKVGAAQMTAGTATNGQILIAGDDATVAWGNVPAPAGTSVTSTGATSGQVLTADGNGGASWQAASGGGNLYKHYISIRTLDANNKNYDITTSIINNSAVPFTLNTLITYITDTGKWSANGLFIYNANVHVATYLTNIGTTIYAGGFKLSGFSPENYNPSLFGLPTATFVSDNVKQIA